MGGEDGLEIPEQGSVDLFDEIVASLVEAVDGPLDLGDLLVGRFGVACLIFLMPEVKVGPVLCADKGIEVGGIERVVFYLRTVPLDCGLVMQSGDGWCVEHLQGRAPLTTLPVWRTWVAV